MDKNILLLAIRAAVEAERKSWKCTLTPTLILK